MSTFIDHGKGNSGTYATTRLTTTTIFHERNDLVLFILSVTHGGYNINIRCNQ